MGGHALPLLVEIGIMYLKIEVRQLPCLPYHWLHPCTAQCRITVQNHSRVQNHCRILLIILHGDYARWLCTVIMHSDSAQWSSWKVIRIRIYKQNHSAESQCRIAVQNCSAESPFRITVQDDQCDPAQCPARHNLDSRIELNYRENLYQSKYTHLIRM